MDRYRRMLFCVFICVCVLLRTSFAQKFEGEICKDENEPWYCRKIADCPTAVAEVKTGGRPPICSFDENIPVVCCRPSSKDVETDSNISSITTVPTQITTAGTRVGTREGTQRRTVPPGTSLTSVPLKSTKAKQKCEEYGKYVYVENQFNPLLGDGGNKYVDRCAIIEQSLVLGGENARLHEYPHMAHIGYSSHTPGENVWLCGGSFISKRFVLSAAHCSNQPYYREATVVRLGALSTKTNDSGTIILKIVHKYVHPNYKEPRIYNDIVLFKLERDVKLGFNIRPICLETENYLPKRAVATGWGRISHDGPPSEILQKAILSIVNVTKCKTFYKYPVRLPNGIDEDTMVCAGDELGIGKDTCDGDAGGPLQYQLKKPYCTYSIIGITSFGIRGTCNPEAPGVYTRISYYVPWIESIVWPE